MDKNALSKQQGTALSSAFDTYMNMDVNGILQNVVVTQQQGGIFCAYDIFIRMAIVSHLLYIMTVWTHTAKDQEMD